MSAVRVRAAMADDAPFVLGLVLLAALTAPSVRPAPGSTVSRH